MLYRTINLETHGSRKKRRIRKMSNEKERQTEKARKRVIEMIKEEEERNGKKKIDVILWGSLQFMLWQTCHFDQEETHCWFQTQFSGASNWHWLRTQHEPSLLYPLPVRRIFNLLCPPHAIYLRSPSDVRLKRKQH